MITQNSVWDHSGITLGSLLQLGKGRLTVCGYCNCCIWVKTTSFQDHVRMTLGPHWDHAQATSETMVFFFTKRQTTPVRRKRFALQRYAARPKTAPSKLILITTHYPRDRGCTCSPHDRGYTCRPCPRNRGCVNRPPPLHNRGLSGKAI